MSISTVGPPLQCKPRSCRRAWLGATLFLLLFAGFIAFAWMMVPTSTPNVAQTRGRFVHPQNGQAVGATVAVELEAGEIPPGYQLWIMEQHGELLWPREPPVTLKVANHWRGKISVAGKNNPLSFAL